MGTAHWIGVGRADMTPPPYGIGFFGYGDPRQRACGLEQRLYARAFIVSDGERAIVFVNCDVGMVSYALWHAVVQELEARFGDRYPAGAVCLSASHTHSAPGGHSSHALYNASILGHSKRVLDDYRAGIVEAIVAADADLQPGRVALSRGVVVDGGVNRSPEAHRSNPGARPAGAMMDEQMVQLTFYGEDDEPAGLLNWYAVHGTSHPGQNRLVSGDNKGYAAWRVESRRGLIAGFAQTSSGDVSPNRVPRGRKLSGEGRTSRESCRISGERQARCALALLDGPSHPVVGPVRSQLLQIDFTSQRVSPAFSSTGAEERLGPAVLGQNFLPGTLDGRGPAWFEDGERRRVASLALLSRWICRLDDAQRRAHGAKHPLIRLNGRWDLAPAVLPVQRLQIGDLTIACVPFELTTEAGRRLREALSGEAAARGLQIRVHGSAHSARGAIGTDGPAHYDVVLDALRRVEWDDDRMEVRVQAGCNLGVDPKNPTSTTENSLLRQLDARGWALPDLGGITHQTVGGFLATGSAGGSATHSLSEAVVAIRLIDGLGRVHTLRPDPSDPDDARNNPFYAAGVSLGLLGVVTEVTFRCGQRYDVLGVNETRPAAGSLVDPDGSSSIADHLLQTEYTRLFWWPQTGVERLQIWSAERGPPRPERRQPMAQIPFGRLGQRVLGWIYAFANTGPRPAQRWRRRIACALFGLFLPLGAARFRGAWLDALPMDDEIHYDLLPCSFTEIFLPLAHAEEAIRRLKDHFASDRGFAHTGTFATELYAGKRSPFWLSPSFDEDTLRVDLIQILRGSAGRPERDFFPGFWALLADLEPRFHWGKHMPPADGPLGCAHLARRYPMMERFLTLREAFDPHQVFVSTYWRRYLGIPLAGEAGVR